MATHDKLRGGTRARLATMRKYRDDWNRKADSGERRYAMRQRLADGLAGVLQARSHGAGKWDSAAHGLAGAFAAKPARDSVSAPVELVDGWRDVGEACDIVSDLPRGWYSDAHQNETYAGHVWQLPARDGVPRYVAGYRESEDLSGYVVLECSRGALVTYDDKRDAARAGDALAESHAEEAREHDERWNEASRHNDEREEARDELKAANAAAREALAALRQQRNAGTVAAGLCDYLRARFAEHREAARRALARIETETAAIEALDMTGEF